LAALALVSGQSALLAFSRSLSPHDPNALAYVVLYVFPFLASIAVSAIIGMSLGITACVATGRSQRWGWFMRFLSLTMLLGLGVVTIGLDLFGALPAHLNAFVATPLLIAPPLALVAAVIIYLIVTAAAGRGQTVPAPSSE
jgi:hypothetical protein